MTLDELAKAKDKARIAFEALCLADYVSKEDYDAASGKYLAAMKEHHDALGFARPAQAKGE